MGQASYSANYTNNRATIARRTVPANLRPYVEALGEEEAEYFFLKLGGCQIYIPGVRNDAVPTMERGGRRPGTTGRGLLFEALGSAERVAALSVAFRLEHGVGSFIKVPLASEWIAIRMAGRGEDRNTIARTVRSDVATVGRWLKITRVGAPMFPATGHLYPRT